MSQRTQPLSYIFFTIGLVLTGFGLLALWNSTEEVNPSPVVQQARNNVPSCKIVQGEDFTNPNLHEVLVYDEVACNMLPAEKSVWSIWDTKPSIFNQCDQNVSKDAFNLQEAEIRYTPVDEQHFIWWYGKLSQRFGRHTGYKIEQRYLPFCGKVWNLGEKNGKYAILMGPVTINNVVRTITGAYATGKTLTMGWMSKAEYNKLAKHAEGHMNPAYK